MVDESLRCKYNNTYGVSLTWLRHWRHPMITLEPLHKLHGLALHVHAHKQKTSIQEK